MSPTLYPSTNQTIYPVTNTSNPGLYQNTYPTVYPDIAYSTYNSLYSNSSSHHTYTYTNSPQSCSYQPALVPIASPPSVSHQFPSPLLYPFRGSLCAGLPQEAQPNFIPVSSNSFHSAGQYKGNNSSPTKSSYVPNRGPFVPPVVSGPLTAFNSSKTCNSSAKSNSTVTTTSSTSSVVVTSASDSSLSNTSGADQSNPAKRSSETTTSNDTHLSKEINGTSEFSKEGADINTTAAMMMQTAVISTGPGGALMDMPPPPPCTSAFIEGAPVLTNGASSPPPLPNSADGGTGDALHAERMEYIRQLVQERDSLATTEGCEVARRLIEQELERVQSGRRSEEKRTVEVTKEKSIKVTVKVQVPVREHPKFNFVGKLLGPKGNSLKRLQEETMTKMAILGRGSFRDKAKEEELRKNPDPKYSHLHEELHVEVTAHAPPAEAYARIAYALTEIRRYLVPDHNDEIRQEQMREMQILGGGNGVLVPLDGLTNGTPNGTDAHTDGSGSLSPPSSLSPPPAVPVKLPHTTLAPTSTHPAQGAVAPHHQNPAMANFLAANHPAMRGITRAQMGLLASAPSYLGSMPNLAATPTLPPGAMLGRYPTMMPLGSIAMPPSQIRSVPLGYEDFTDMTSLQPSELDQSFTNGYDAEKNKDAALKAAGAQVLRGRFRHEPYRRIINVPS